jgi:hypothetical protein
MTPGRALAALVVLLVLLEASPTPRGAAPRFFPDDPIWIDHDTVLDASKVVPVEDTNGYDFLVNTFVKPGDRRDVRALNLNTVDEVPDSSWFTNRIGRRELTLDEIVRGPDSHPRISLEGWVVSAGKSRGVQPGFRMTAPDGQMYQIEFDPPSNPEMATGAEVVGTAIYHAIGYHTVEVYLASLDPAALVIAPTARVFDPMLGERRPLTRADVDRVLARAARAPDGTYRVLASRFAAGDPLGNFRYYGVRPDDPNDLFPHEHRRELRAARVFGAWLNHDDSRGVNSLDMLEKVEGRGFVKHYMFDFGSIMGSGTAFAQTRRGGYEYIFEPSPGWLTLATFGLYMRPWMQIEYPDVPASVGRFEADAFDPLIWKPEYPNVAFDNMRADDAFWAARIVSRFTDEAIRRIVEKADYSDPRATEYLTRTLVARRNKVVRAWITGVNPIVDVAVGPDGAVTFGNAAVDANVAWTPAAYVVQLSRFDNASGAASPIGSAITVKTPRLMLPPEARALGTGEYLQISISTTHPSYPAWRTPVVAHVRRTASGWHTAGLTRLP